MIGLGSIPPATAMNYISWGIVKYSPFVIVLTCSFIFNFLIKRRWPGWWIKYNYVLVCIPLGALSNLQSAGLDIGLAIGTMFIFFVFTYREIQFPSWWGTEVVKNTADILGTPLRTVEPGYLTTVKFSNW